MAGDTSTLQLQPRITPYICPEVTAYNPNLKLTCPFQGAGGAGLLGPSPPRESQSPLVPGRESLSPHVQTFRAGSIEIISTGVQRPNSQVYRNILMNRRGKDRVFQDASHKAWTEETKQVAPLVTDPPCANSTIL